MVKPLLLHGGDTAGYRARHGRDAIDFSASLNPLGMPAAAREAARRAVDDSCGYPDPLCRGLSAALAAELRVPETYLHFGNGAADVIHRLVLAVRPRRALVTAPSFAEYERALDSVGCRTERHLLLRGNNFDVQEDILEKIVPPLDLLFLCQPNNPTGRLIPPALLEEILHRCAEAGTLLVVDECFLRFVDDPAAHSLRRFLEDFENLVILDSFTKLYAMAGLRLGHAISGNIPLVEKLASQGQPWPVSTVAQAAGIAALKETTYVEDSFARIRREKENLLAALAELPVRVIGHAANFLFFSSRRTDLAHALADEGILIRDCANFPGLAPGDYRIAVRLENENKTFLDSLTKALQ